MHVSAGTENRIWDSLVQSEGIYATCLLKKSVDTQFAKVAECKWSVDLITCQEKLERGVGVGE